MQIAILASCTFYQRTEASMSSWKSALVAAMAAIIAGPVGAVDWPLAGKDRENTRHQRRVDGISPGTAADLAVRWVAELNGSVLATPSVEGDAVYATDAGDMPLPEGDPCSGGGSLWRLDAHTGAVVWCREISDYTGAPGDLSRNTPAIAGDRLILGNTAGFLGQGPAVVMAVDKDTGDGIWQTAVDTHPTSIITSSPVVHGDVVYVGVSSADELLAGAVPGYPCCSFRGSLVALDKNTGAVIWKTYTVPDTGETPDYSGAAIWGNTPVVSPQHGLIFAATGNNYTVPAGVADCAAEAKIDDGYDEAIFNECLEIDGLDHFADNHFDSVLAFDIASGEIAWSYRGETYDPWTLACLNPDPNPQNCQDPEGPDYDFGQGPSLFRARSQGWLLGAGQKSGVYHALDPSTGELVWKTNVGPGGILGGLQWGSATDSNRIYVTATNSDHAPNSGPGSSWAALDAATGTILWRTTVEGEGFAHSPATVVNGVVFVGSMARGVADDTMFALRATDGEILWRFASGGSVNTSPAGAADALYWGSGYVGFSSGSPNNKLYAFEVQLP